MKRSARMEKLAEINLGYENTAVAALATARANYQKQENQLEQLRIYREDYREQLTKRMQGSTSVNALRDFQYFFESLDDAITQQSREVERVAMELEKVEKNWLNCRQEVKKFNQAAGNLRRQENDAAERRAQLENDELSTANYVRRMQQTNAY